MFHTQLQLVWFLHRNRARTFLVSLCANLLRPSVNPPISSTFTRARLAQLMCHPAYKGHGITCTLQLVSSSPLLSQASLPTLSKHFQPILQPSNLASSRDASLTASRAISLQSPIHSLLSSFSKHIAPHPTYQLFTPPSNISVCAQLSPASRRVALTINLPLAMHFQAFTPSILKHIYTTQLLSHIHSIIKRLPLPHKFLQPSTSSRRIASPRIIIIMRLNFPLALQLHIFLLLSCLYLAPSSLIFGLRHQSPVFVYGACFQQCD